MTELREEIEHLVKVVREVQTEKFKAVRPILLEEISLVTKLLEGGVGGQIEEQIADCIALTETLNVKKSDFLIMLTDITEILNTVIRKYS